MPPIDAGRILTFGLTQAPTRPCDASEIFSGEPSPFPLPCTMDHRKPLGIVSATALVIANMVGAGLFTTSGYALADLGEPRYVMWGWALGGAIAICGAISYGALCRRISQSGGEYLYLSRLVHPAAGFVAGWVSMLAGFTGAIAFSAAAFEVYAVPENVRPPWLPHHAAAIVLIVVCSVLHAFRVRTGAISQNAIVALKLVLLAIFVGFVVFVLPGLRVERALGVSPTPFELSRFAASLVWISLAYSGFNAAVYLADEVQDAATVIPWSLLWGTVTVTVIYLALNAIFVYGVPVANVVGQGDIAAVVARILGGPRLGFLMRLIIGLALASSVSSMLQVGPRVMTKMADDGFLPPWLRSTPAAPAAAVLFQASLAVVAVCLATLQQLLTYLGFTLSISAAATAASLFLPAQRGVLLSRPVILPAAVIYVVSTLSVAAVAAWHRPHEMTASVLTLGSGLLLYAASHRRQLDRVEDDAAPY